MKPRVIAVGGALVLLLLIAGLTGRRAADLGTASIMDRASPVDPLPRDPALAETAYRARLTDDRDGAAADPVIRYNLGTAILLQDRYVEAREHLLLAMEDSGSHRSAAAYNLGTADLLPAFRDSLLAERDRRLRNAVAAFRAALIDDPADLDAKWNLELAMRLLQQQTAPEQGGGGAGGGGDGPPDPGSARPVPNPASGSGPQPRMSESEAEELLRGASEREQRVLQESVRRPQPPGPIRP